MEKIRFGTETFDLVPVGASFKEDKAKITFVLPDSMSYEMVEATVSGKERIEVLDGAGELLAAYRGYIYLDTLMKQKDRVIGVQQVEAGTNEAGETVYENRNMTATVMIATLKRSDVREELEATNAKLDYIAMMSDIDMEV